MTRTDALKLAQEDGFGPDEWDQAVDLILATEAQTAARCIEIADALVADLRGPVCFRCRDCIITVIKREFPAVARAEGQNAG